MLTICVPKILEEAYESVASFFSETDFVETAIEDVRQSWLEIVSICAAALGNINFHMLYCMYKEYNSIDISVLSSVICVLLQFAMSAALVHFIFVANSLAFIGGTAFLWSVL